MTQSSHVVGVSRRTLLNHWERDHAGRSERPVTYPPYRVSSLHEADAFRIIDAQQRTQYTVASDLRVRVRSDE